MMKKMSGESGGCAIGAFVNGVENLESFQAMVGRKLAVVLIYVHWFEPFPLEIVEAIYENGSIPLLTWEPWVTHEKGALAAITSGCYDDYINDFIKAIKNWSKPIFLRFAHEMNGNWYPWDGDHNGRQQAPEKYQQAYKYIYNVREKIGAQNIKLVWSPNNESLPQEAWNIAANYYPGDKYVDWLGLDGYNWGYSKWQTFEQIFGPAYQHLVELADKPIMIAEFASVPEKKDFWFNEALNQLKNKFTRIRLFCWFNINKERDWRLDSGWSSKALKKSTLQESYFLDRIKEW